MARIEVSTSGAREIDAQLARLPVELREKTLKRALTKAGTAGVRNARREAPKNVSGGGDASFKPLKKQIHKRTLKSRETKAGEVGVKVRVISGHAHLLEFGHRAVVGGTRKSGKGRVVGFVEPVPFFRPAYEASKSEIERIMVDALRGFVDEITPAN